MTAQMRSKLESRSKLLSQAVFTRTVVLGPDIDTAALTAHLAECLRRSGACDIEIDAGRITFDGDLVCFWRTLSRFGPGDITIDAEIHSVCFRLSYRNSLVSGTWLIGLMAAFSFLVVMPATHSLVPLIFIPLVWLCFIVSHFVVGLPVFRRFVRRTIATAPRIER
jgi:hypothetical protein